MKTNAAAEICSFQLICLPNREQGFTEKLVLRIASGMLVVTSVAAWCRISGALTLLADIHLVKNLKARTRNCELVKDTHCTIHLFR